MLIVFGAAVFSYATFPLLSPPSPLLYNKLNTITQSYDVRRLFLSRARTSTYEKGSHFDEYDTHNGSNWRIVAYDHNDNMNNNKLELEGTTWEGTKVSEDGQDKRRHDYSHFH